MISVIIPTHNSKYLDEAIESVLKQTYQDFEIVLLLNGNSIIDTSTLKTDLTNNLKINVCELPNSTNVIGLIKKTAFSKAVGDILVELDHDDILAPNALELIAEAFKDESIDFVYSNTARFHNEWTPDLYGDGYGWKYRDFQYKDHTLIQAVAFDPTPASIGYVWWAPDHVRAWRRSFYEKVGGHDINYPICDDHDLVVRTYLNGRMKRIDECLYLYRVHNNQTSYNGTERNAKVQTLTHKIYAEKIEAIVKRWCDLEKLPHYDLGGAFNNLKGWEPIDLSNGVDLSKKWPWADSSIGAFRAYDFLEHLPDKMHTLSEIHRCLVPGGWLLSHTPSALGQGAFQDPTHVSYWVKNSFKYVTNSEFAKYINNTKVRFQAMRLVESFPNDYCKEENIPYVTADLVCLKDGYTGPGQVLI